ncbi:MAG: hypothetical protein IPJ10_01800 [Flavobacteriales bacterium]|jgi:hypothetical protein|nr:hypothetical protein [Flavobacteriales bacterium]
MKIQLTLTAFALALFSLGCTNNASETAEAHDHHPDTPVAEDHDHAEADHDHAEAEAEIPEVTLDNGKRWIANAETTEGIAKMSALITNYDPATGDPKALKAGLEEEFALIFERCTMTGESHNQLHNYLLPLHQDMSDIDLTKSEELDLLKAYLGTYKNYFE